MFILRVSVLILFLVIDTNALIFSHPGALHSKAELDFIKSQILVGAQPWTGEYNRMVGTAYATATPRGMRFVLSTNNNQANTIRDDAFAAYSQALIWYFSENELYAEKAIAILNSWAGLQGFVSGSNQDKILAGWTGALFAPAAEIMRLYPAWSANSISALQAMFRLAYYPQLNSMSTWNGNADLTQIDAMISIAVFNEDESEFNLGLARMDTRIPAYFYLSSAGPVPNIDGDGGNINQFWFNPYQWVDGLTQETCRDYGHHVQFAPSSVLHAMETAWHQGIDVYTPHQSRIMAVMELQAWSFLTDSMLGLCSPSPIAPTTNRYDTWEIGYNHYHNRQGVPLPNTLKLIMTQIRPNAFRDSRGWNIAYETLTHGNLTDAVTLPTVRSTMTPSAVHSEGPTVVPTRAPTTPSMAPSSNPTPLPSLSPTSMPVLNPSVSPTNPPVSEPTIVSSTYPTLFPSSPPSMLPTQLPLSVATETSLDITVLKITIQKNRVNGYNANGCLDNTILQVDKYSAIIKYSIANTGAVAFEPSSEFVGRAACNTPAITKFLQLNINGGKDGSGNNYPINLERFATCVIDDSDNTNSCTSQGSQQRMFINQGGSYGVSKNVVVKFPLTSDQYNALTRSGSLTFTLSVNSAISLGVPGVASAIDGSQLSGIIWKALDGTFHDPIDIFIKAPQTTAASTAVPLTIAAPTAAPTAVSQTSAVPIAMLR